MANEMEMKNAQAMYDKLCEMLDDRNVKYDKTPEKLSVHFIMNGDDIPMDIVIMIDAERKLVRLFSKLPFEFGEEKRLEGSIATNQINYDLVHGNFDYDMKEGKVFYKLVSSYRESLISKEALAYMVACLCTTVDEYNDKLLLLAKGKMTLEELIASIG